MSSMEGMVPITRAFLASYYDKYPFAPLSDDVRRLTAEIRSMATDLRKDISLTEGDLFQLMDSVHFPFFFLLFFFFLKF